jgi:hypothetical protein
MKHFSESYDLKLQIPLSVHALNADLDSVGACMRRAKLAMASRHYPQTFSAICWIVAFPEDHGQVRENEHLVGEFEVVLEELRNGPLIGFRVLRTGRASVVIRRLVHHSWYGPAGGGLSWAGTSWKGSAGQGPAMSHETRSSVLVRRQRNN